MRRRKNEAFDTESTAALLQDSDPIGMPPRRRDPYAKLVVFPEDLEEPSEITLGESLPPAARSLYDPETGPTHIVAPAPRRPLPSQVPTTSPGPSPFTGRADWEPTAIVADSVPVALPPRALRPGRRSGGRAAKRRARVKPSLPGDLRTLVQARDRRSQRGRIVAWVVAPLILVAIPAAIAGLLVPGTWEWLLLP